VKFLKEKISERIEQRPPGLRLKFDFAMGAEAGVVPKIRGRRSKSPQPPFTKGGQEGIKKGGAPAVASAKAGTTTLERIHAAMVLQSRGQTNALRALLKAEQDRGPDL
jgi:hypothetical protein